MTAKKGKTNAKKEAAPKSAPKKGPAVKKTQAKKQTAVKKAAAAKPVAAKAVPVEEVVTPRRGDIVAAYGKHFRVDMSSKQKLRVMGTHLTMVECKMTGDCSRMIPWHDIAAIYRLAT